jgi:hypothetical protein
MTTTTHPDWLPQGPEELRYAQTLLVIQAHRDAGDEAAACTKTREILKPQLEPYGGHVPSLRGQILATAIGQRWLATCTTCDGSGYIERMIDGDLPSAHDCPRCDGMGLIETERTA